MSRTVTIEEANAEFAALLQHVIAEAEEVIIARGGVPVARLVPSDQPLKPRVPGCDAGKFVVPPEFFDPLPAEILDEFYK